MKKIIIIGAGGHANSCIEVIRSSKIYKIAYFVEEKKNLQIQPNKKIITEKQFLKKKPKNKNIHIAIGQLKDGKNREKIFKSYKKLKCNFPIIKSSSSIISKTSRIGEGSIIMHYAFINYNSKIGKNCIINTRATIEHDCIIEDNVHIAPGAIILGGSYIEKNSFIGCGAVIKQNSKIKKESIIPARKYFK